MSVGLNKAELQSDLSLTAVKTAKHSYPLPEDGMEVSLSYPGKLPESKVLEPVSEPYLKYLSSKKKQNAHIEPNSFVLSDNWFALHAILASKIRPTLIYLDPPYGTGLDFQSRQLEHAYGDTLGNAAYVEFIRRRLILMREILTDDGSIYIHIGHQMLAQLKLIMDEVFGIKNFRNLIIRRKCSSKNFTKNQYSNLNDYILFYTKTASYKWNQPTIKPTEEWVAKEYPKHDARGAYKLVPVHAPGVRHGETGTQWRGMSPPPGKHWQYRPSKLDELDAAGEIHWSKNGNPRRKVYLGDNKGVTMTDYWDQYRDAHHQSVMVSGYPTEKNLDMLKVIIGASSNEGDIVLDPFCGSGTTLQAANELSRRWIGIDQSFTAAKATISRLRNGLKPMGDFVVKPKKILDLFEESVPTITKPNKSQAPEFSFIVDADIAENFSAEVAKLAAI
jgi:adenine-specific DNA-methyltransferase